MNPTHVLWGDVAATAVALDVNCVREVLPWSPLQPVPSPTPPLEGVLQARGRVVPILRVGPRDPAAGAPPVAAGAGGREPRRIVLAERTDGAWIGIAMDRVRGIRRVAPADLRPRNAATSGLLPSYVTGWVASPDGLAALLSPDLLLGARQEEGLQDWFGPLAERLSLRADKPGAPPRQAGDA